MRRFVPTIGFFVMLALSQLVFTLLWGDDGRLILLSVLIALSFALSLGVARAERALRDDLARMSEAERRALRAEHSEEAEEMAEVVGVVSERHWVSQGVREFTLEMFEAAGALIAFFALPVIVSIVRDGHFSMRGSVTIWQLGLGVLGAAVYVGARHWLKRMLEKGRGA